MKSLIELTRDSFFAIIFHLAPRFANVILFIILGRILGASVAGTFTLATTYLLISATIMRGMDDLIVREVSRDPSQAKHYLFNFTLLRLALSIAIFFLAILFVFRFLDYPPETLTIILIIMLSLIPDGVSYVSQSILLAKRNFLPPALIFSTVNLSKIIIAILIINNSGDIIKIAWVWFFGSLLIMILILSVTIYNIGDIKIKTSFNWKILATNKKAILIFMSITTLATLETQSDTIILSVFYSEEEVGWYGAATTIAYSLIMFSQAYRFAVYPLMTRYAHQSPPKLISLYNQSLEYLALLVIPLTAGLLILSPQIIPLIFGNGFSPTIFVLQILSFTLIFTILNEANIRLILVKDRQNDVLKFLFVATIINILLNFILIPNFSVNGAAVARLGSIIVFFLLCFIFINNRIHSTNIFQYIWRPAISAIIMSLVVLPFRDYFIIIPILLGVAVYFVILFILGGLKKPIV